MLRFYFECFVFCLITTLTMSALAENKIIRIVSDEWPPITGSQLPKGGFSVHFATDILNALGYEFTVEFIPWKRIERTQKQGRYDMIVAMWYDKVREQGFAYTQPYLDTKVVFASLKEQAFTYSDLASLNGKTVGMVSSYAYPEALLNYEKVTWHTGIDLNQNLKKLIAKRLDMVIGTDAVMQYEVKQKITGSKYIYFDTDHPVEIRPVHMAINRNTQGYAVLVKKIDKVIQTFKQDGRLQALKDIYGLH